MDRAGYIDGRFDTCKYEFASLALPQQPLNALLIVLTLNCWALLSFLLSLLKQRVVSGLAMLCPL